MSKFAKSFTTFLFVMAMTVAACSKAPNSQSSLSVDNPEAQARSKTYFLPAPGTQMTAEDIRKAIVAHPELAPTIIHEHPIINNSDDPNSIPHCVPGQSGLLQLPNGEIFADPMEPGMCAQGTPFPKPLEKRLRALIHNEDLQTLVIVSCVPGHPDTLQLPDGRRIKALKTWTRAITFALRIDRVCGIGNEPCCACSVGSGCADQFVDAGSE